MGIYHLWPLSMTEIEGINGPQVHHWFDAPFGWDSDAITWDAAPSRKEYFEWVCSGGYQKAMSLAARGRKQWQESYLATVIDRDIQALSRVRSSTAISRLMLWAAASTSQELNISNAAKDLSLSRSVLMHYMEWVKSVGLIHQLDHWSRNHIEIKATSTPQPHHMKHLRWLRDRMDRASSSCFKAGYLLHTGKSCLTISDRLHFRPIAALWRDVSHQVPLLTGDTDYQSSTQSGS